MEYRRCLEAPKFYRNFLNRKSSVRTRNSNPKDDRRDEISDEHGEHGRAFEPGQPVGPLLGRGHAGSEAGVKEVIMKQRS